MEPSEPSEFSEPAESQVKLSQDGSSIDFSASEELPTTVKKFRQSAEIEGFYRFVYENNLQKEALSILNEISQERKNAKAASRTKK